MTVTKADIISRVAEGTGLSQVETEAVFDGIIDSIIETLKKNERVELRGFGTFGVRKRDPRKARNPGTGETVYLPKRYVATFKPSPLLKKELTLKLLR